MIIGMVISAQAQGVLQVTQISGTGVGYFGAGYFLIDANTVQFQIDVFTTLFSPVDTDNSNVQLTTPAGWLNFSIGLGTPTFFNNATGNEFPDPFVPPPPTRVGSPLLTPGKQYGGSFQSSPDFYADLLAGEGQFLMVSGSTVYALGSLQVVAAPEPESYAVFLSGIMLLLWQRMRKA
jgi:hypothetical protein